MNTRKTENALRQEKNIYYYFLLIQNGNKINEKEKGNEVNLGIGCGVYLSYKRRTYANPRAMKIGFIKASDDFLHEIPSWTEATSFS